MTRVVRTLARLSGRELGVRKLFWTLRYHTYY